MDKMFESLEAIDGSSSRDPDGDEATLRQLANAGSDLSKPTEFIHYLSFPSEGEMLAAGRAMRESLGYRLQWLGPEDEGGDWSLHVTIERLPSIENVRKMRKIMEVAADRFGGSYDGWEAAVSTPARGRYVDADRFVEWPRRR